MREESNRSSSRTSSATDSTGSNVGTAAKSAWRDKKVEHSLGLRAEEGVAAEACARLLGRRDDSGPELLDQLLGDGVTQDCPAVLDHRRSGHLGRNRLPSHGDSDCSDTSIGSTECSSSIV